MNVPYLLKTLKTNKLSEVVANIDGAPLDINIAIWDAIDNGEIEVDEEKDRITALKEAELWHDEELTTKILKVIRHYTKNETNITRGNLFKYLKDPMTMQGYNTHDYLMSLQYLIDTGVIKEYEVSVPEIKKKRPYHKFVFLCLPQNDNEEWNAKAVNNWIENWEKKK